jgi:hypothetical protein
MARIILVPPGSGGDLTDGFVKALALLADGGFKPRAGTKLVSRYAVIVVNDAESAPAVAHLRARNLTAFVESHS